MFFAKRRSFTIIEIESMEIINYKKFSLDRAIKLINSEQTFLQHFLFVYYNIIKKILNYVYLNDMYYKTFCINNFKLKNNEHWYISNKSTNLLISSSSFV